LCFGATTSTSDLEAILANLHNDESIRLRIMLFFALVAFTFLGGSIWRIQVLKASEYRSSETRQSIRRVRRPAPRGRIFDRNGVLLAGNRPSYSIAVFVEELRQPGRISNTVARIATYLDEIGTTIGKPREVTHDEIAVHIRKRRPLPLLAWKDIDEVTLARWSENPRSFRGVDVYVEPVRVYPGAPIAGHTIGYVGRRDWDETDTPYHYYLPDIKGRAGIERTLDDRLSGKAGGRLVRVDASGFKYDEQVEIDPVPGEDVMLTIDVRIQSVVEDVLRGERGACVVMSPQNGDVLAIASAPAFDTTVLRSAARYKAAMQDPGRPMFNRAIAGAYPPGSTFKPVVAIAALEAGLATAETVIDCPGYYAVGEAHFNCWRTIGHGPLDLRRSLEQSCNTYFIDLGVQIGYERIFHMANALGFGRPTGLGLRGEVSGLMPDDAWKRKKYRDGWRKGDTCNASIGQGFVLASPVQMAMFVSTLANGGNVMRPRLFAEAGETTGEIVNKMNWNPDTLEVIRGGMLDVIHATTGTGRLAKINHVRMAGKTGSAEYGPRSNRKKYAWMIVFAPVERPRYAVALVIENALSGGRTAAPRVQRIMERVFDIEQGIDVDLAEGGA
jgi:penicillin-binding protein 2